MELIKKSEPLEFTYKDVTFVIRSTATARDKFLLDTQVMGNQGLNDEGKASASIRDIYTILVKLFVTDWKGVTQDGKLVPYSFDVLCSSFPSDPNDDVFLRLGAFIATKTGILPTGDESLKNA